MKRMREDGIWGGPNVKRPSSVRVEMSEQSQPIPSSSTSAQKLTTDDALTYLKAVKDMFKDDKDKYDEFLEVMKDFKAQRIDTAGVIRQVKELFKGHRALILGFNAFLPKGYEITLPIDEEPPAKKQPVEFNQAINYVNKIKTRFNADEHVYKAFLEILNMYRKGNKSIGEVYQEVATLFHEHGDLLEEFTYFLPDSTGPAAVTTATSRPAMQQIIRRDEKNVNLKATRHPEKVVKKEKSVSVHSDRDRERDRGLERHGERDAERPAARLDREQRKKVEKDRDKKDEFERNTLPKEEKDSDLEKEKDVDLLQRLPHKRKSARRADELIRKQSQGGEAGEALHPLSAPVLSVEDKLGLKSTALHKEQLAFFDKVKGRLRNRDAYQEFLKCLNIFSQEIISRSELQGLVADILGKHTDLMDGFNEFLSRRENLEGYLAGFLSGKKLDFVEAATLKPKLEKDTERQRDREREKDWDNERERDKDRDRDRPVLYSMKDVVSHKPTVIPTKEKYTSKPISELDLSNCERCTPSYRLLPKNYSRPITSHRTELAQEVLNDNWVSVTSGSEDYSFKHMRKNQYEESLFRCEDDRFELDMLLESTSGTAKCVVELVEKLRDPNFKQEPVFHLDDHLTAIHMRCIERIYGDHGLDFLELVRKNAASALSVVLVRLQQKHEEWSRCRVDMNKVWAEVYTKNYYRSLDHRSFYFKQQDKKSLSTKSLLSEIKDVNERKKREDDHMLATVAGNRLPLIPDLRFPYPDSMIHEDLYQIIKYSTEQVCTSTDQSNRIMRIWTTFLEHIFGVHTRPRLVSMKRGDEDAKFKSKETKFTEHFELENGETGNNAVVVSSGASLWPNSAVSLNHTSGSIGDATGNASRHIEWPTSSSPAKSRIPSKLSGGMSSEMAVEQLSAGFNWKDTGAEVKSKGACKNEQTSFGIGPQQPVSEKEEGELSPTPEVEDRSRALPFSDDNADGRSELHTLGCEPKDDAGMKESMHSGDDAELEADEDFEGDMDADGEDEPEESAQKSSEDSGDQSDAADEISGSEFAEADDLSHEEENDDDDEELEPGGKIESEGERNGIAECDDGEGEGTSSLASPTCSFSTCKPLAPHASGLEETVSKETGVFYGNDIFYILFRLYQTLYERIHSAKINSVAAEQKWKFIKDSDPPNFYAKFLRVLYDLLDGSTDNARFEDECRAIIGTQSYILFTLDKLIFKFVKQLQAVTSDDLASKLLLLHDYEKFRRPGQQIDVVYHANASILVQDDNIYRVEHRSNPAEMLIQLMEGGAEKVDVPGSSMEYSFSNYLNNFLISLPDEKDTRRVFLARNKRKNGGEDADTLMGEVMARAEVINGLEYKICCNTFKVSYVLDTEDLFHKMGRRGLKKQGKIPHEATREPHVAMHQQSSRQKRVSRFHKWIETRLQSLDDTAVFNSQFGCSNTTMR